MSPPAGRSATVSRPATARDLARWQGEVDIHLEGLRENHVDVTRRLEGIERRMEAVQVNVGKVAALSGLLSGLSSRFDNFLDTAASRRAENRDRLRFAVLGGGIGTGTTLLVYLVQRGLG